MNKRKFIDELKYYLRLAYWDKNSTEIDDIIRDYEEYFREGMDAGKSEDEISSSLGRPKDIVDEIIRVDIDDGKYKMEDFYAYNNDVDRKLATQEINANSVNRGKKYDKRNYLHSAIKFIKVVFLILFDLIYFPTVVSMCLSLMGLGVGAFIIIPYISELYVQIGQNRLALIFMILLGFGLILFFASLMFYLIKFGLRFNSYIFSNTKSKEVK